MLAPPLPPAVLKESHAMMQVSTLTRVRDRRTESPGATPPPPQPSTEQANIIRRLRASRDPWSQLGLTRGCGKEEVNRSYRWSLQK